MLAALVLAGGAAAGAVLATRGQPPQGQRFYEGPPIRFTGNPLQGRSIVAKTVAAADARLPFHVVLPSAKPTGMWTTDSTRTPVVSRQVVADFRTPIEGVFQLSEKPTDWTVASLRSWADRCTTCTIQKVVLVRGVHVLVMASPGGALAVSWIRGDGARPLLTSVIGPYRRFTQESALAVAADVIRRGG